MLCHIWKDADLCSIHGDITSLAKQYIDHWKSGDVSFIMGKVMSNFVLGVHPNVSGFWVTNNAQYQRNCHFRYTSYKIENQTHSLLKKKAPLTQISRSSQSLTCSTSRDEFLLPQIPSVFYAKIL